jgi:UPF0148 protein
MEDKKISEAVKLLYKGAKMLPYHCPDCQTPIFEVDKKMFCPSCGRIAVFEKDINNKPEKELLELSESMKSKVDSERKHELEGLGHKVGHKVGHKQPEHLKNSSVTLEKALNEKIGDLSKLLIETEEPDEIERIISLIERILRLIEKLRSER